MERDTRLDVANGVAGCIASLLCLYQVASSSRALSIAVRCGDHLLAHAQPLSPGIGWYTLGQQEAAPGFLHGTAGIALSLLRLAAGSQEERFREAALKAMAYERSLFDAGSRPWLQKTGQQKQEIPVSWCNGASGIALSRLAARAYLADDMQLLRDTESTLETTIEKGFGWFGSIGWNPSLCHGDLGNLDAILTATQMLEGPAYHEALQQRTAQVFSGIQERGWVTGVPQGIETPGLITGIAGIGYELLRLAQPDLVPSVLLLAPPV